MTDSGDAPRVAGDAIPLNERNRAMQARTRSFAKDRLSGSELETQLDGVYPGSVGTERVVPITGQAVLGSAEWQVRARGGFGWG